MAFHQRGELEQAGALYATILASNPDHFTATHLLGVIKTQQGDFQGAVQLLAEALSLNPRSALAHLNLGIALWSQDRPGEALTHYRYSLILKPDQPEALMHCALALHSLHRNEEALASLDKLLALQPEATEALLNRGIILQELHQPGAALNSFERALAINPEDPAILLNLGISLGELKRPEEAMVRFDQVLAHQPDLPEALFHRGFARQGQGRYQEALEDFQRTLALRPQWVAALINCATVLHLTQQSKQALALLKQALAISPDLPEGLLNCGIVLQALHQPGDALACFDRLLTLQPDHAGALMDRGNALLGLQRPQEALASLDLALVLQPDNPDILSNHGSALLTLGHPEGALADCDRALALRSDHGDALMNRGTALLALNQPTEALASFDLALALEPERVEALLNRGNALVRLHRIEEAMVSYDLGLALQPDHLETLLSRGTALHRLGRHLEAIACYDRVLALQSDHAKAHSNKIFVLDYIPEVDFKAHQQARRAYFLAQAEGLPIVLEAEVRDGDPARPLVLGYVSADFRRHSAAACFGPVLYHHDRKAFRIICYSGTTVEDDWTRRFRGVADVWRPTAGLSDDAMAALIRADGVDILIDLSGHSEGNRLLVFARKPAPIQITAWGHGGGTGLPMIDYQFTDPVIIPPEVRTLFAEAPYDLPCCITFEAPAYAPEILELPARLRGFVTFGSLNRFMKVTPAMLALWARILGAVPSSRLLLKDGALDDPGIQDQVRATFAGSDIAPERILLRGFTSHQDHLAVYNEVDIVLDTFPQNGGITAWEALWMGVPVLALLGSKPPSRLSGAVLHALGLDAWIAASEADYLELAVRQAGDLDCLARFRQVIRRRIAASAAGNPILYTRAVEEAYRAMWKRWLEQTPRGNPWKRLLP